MESLLEVTNLSLKLNKFSLQNISFSLPKGYIMGYIGRNGAGKTTTLKLIIDMFKADSGTIRVEGRQCEQDCVAFKNSIGYIGDEFYYPPAFKLKNVCSTLRDFYPSFNEKRFYTLAKAWDLPGDKKILEYSKGMKVKLMFAGIFSRKTSLLILDEATNGLDPLSRNEVLELLQEYIKDGQSSVLFSTHLMEDLEQISDYIFFLDQGKEVFFDTKDAILDRFVLAKGGNEDLAPELKRNLIGCVTTSIGFEGLLDTKYLELASRRLTIEKPTIDNIVVHYIKNQKDYKSALVFDN